MTDTTTAVATTEQPRAKPPVVQAGGTISAMIPTDIDQAFRLARAIAMSGMAPKAYGQDENKCFVGILAGAEVGFAPMQALQSIAVINGNPSIWGDGAMALVQASGLLEEIEETDDGNEATCRVVRKGLAPIVRTFDMDDAKKAGLAGKAGPWTQYPKRMRQMRARSWALRDGFADVLKGLHIAEEVRDRPEQPEAPQTMRLSSDMLAEQAGVTVEQPQIAQDVISERTDEAVMEAIEDIQFEANEARRDRLADDIQDDEIAEAAQQTLDEIDGPLDQAEAEPEEPPFMGKVRDIRAAIDKCSTIIDLNNLAKAEQVHVEALPEEWAEVIKRDFAAVRARLGRK
jgi:hypothetical protein